MFLQFNQIFQGIWKLSGPSREYPGYPETFRAIPRVTRKNFPDKQKLPATIPPKFLGLGGFLMRKSEKKGLISKPFAPNLHFRNRLTIPDRLAKMDFLEHFLVSDGRTDILRNGMEIMLLWF